MLIDVDEQVKALLEAGVNKDEAVRLVLVSWALANTDNPYDGIAVAGLLTHFVMTGEVPMQLVLAPHEYAEVDTRSGKTKKALTTPTEIPCLKCQSLFKSDGRGNRICDKCKTTAEWQSGGLEEQSLAEVAK
jgi:hypothetical protein